MLILLQYEEMEADRCYMLVQFVLLPVVTWILYMWLVGSKRHFLIRMLYFAPIFSTACLQCALVNRSVELNRVAVSEQEYQQDHFSCWHDR